MQLLHIVLSWKKGTTIHIYERKRQKLELSIALEINQIEKRDRP